MRRFALLLIAACAAPQPAAPQETTQQRINRVAAERREETRRRSDERTADSVRRRDAAEEERQAAAAKKADEVAAQRSDARAALDADCATDRTDRMARRTAALAERAENERKHAAAEEWVEKRCKRVSVDDYQRIVCDDGSAVAKMCNRKVGEHEEYRCPPGAPKGVSATGITTGQTAGEHPAANAASADSRRNSRCREVDGLDGGAP